MNEKMRGLHFEAVECDEIWTFVGKKDAVLKVEERKNNPELGNQYTRRAQIPSATFLGDNVAWEISTRS